MSATAAASPDLTGPGALAADDTAAVSDRPAPLLAVEAATTAVAFPDLKAPLPLTAIEAQRLLGMLHQMAPAPRHEALLAVAGGSSLES